MRRTNPAIHWSRQPKDPPTSVRQGVLGFVPRARTSDPLTSHEAAAHVPEFSSHHHGLIHAALVEHGDATSYEIAERTGLDQVQVARRMIELEVPPARVVRTAATRPGPSGRQCTVWRAIR